MNRIIFSNNINSCMQLQSTSDRWLRKFLLPNYYFLPTVSNCKGKKSILFDIKGIKHAWTMASLQIQKYISYYIIKLIKNENKLF